MTGDSIGMLYISYGLLPSLGIGTAYNTLLSVSSAKGTCSRVLMMSFGLSTMVLGQIASKLFDVPSIGWRRTFLGLALSFLPFLFFAL